MFAPFALLLVLLAVMVAFVAFFSTIVGVIGITGIWVVNLFGAGITYTVPHVFLAWVVYILTIVGARAMLK